MTLKQLFQAIMAAVVILVNTEGKSMAQRPSAREEVKIQTDLHCESCKKKIVDYMTFEKGVTAIAADVDSKVVTIEYRTNRTNEEKLVKALEKLGYKAAVIKEEEKVNDPLPDQQKH